jgi:hypothetical protein
MPAQSMAVVYTRGEPAAAAKQALPALYAAIYGLRSALKQQGRSFKVGPLRARWPDAHLVPKEHWTGVWGLPLPDGVDTVPEKKPGVAITREVWEYGTVAEILHVGPYTMEAPTVQQLHDFITEHGYEIWGPHEEEYLTSPRARVQKTVVRYAVRRKERER